MNKLLRIIIATFMVFAVSDCFATNYDLWIGGTRVTSDNASHITSDCLFNGTASYNNTTKVLTLTNAHIVPSRNEHGVHSKINGLKIELVGENSISTSWVYKCIYSEDADLTIQGTGTLAASSEMQDCIWIKNGNLTIQGGCSVDAVSKNHSTQPGAGILGSQGKILHIDNSVLTAKGYSDNCGSIGGFDDVTYTGVTLCEPQGATYNTIRNCFYVSGQIVKVKIEIGYNHHLWVAGHQLELGQNIYHFTGSGIQGSVYYDYQTNVLTLSNAKIDVSSDYAIKSYIPNLTINLIGADTIRTTARGIFSDHCNLSITGNGSLYEYTDYANGIDVTCGDLNIYGNCTVNVRVESWDYGSAIYGNASYKLYVSDATVKVYNKYKWTGPIQGFGEIIYTRVTPTYPAGVSYNTSERRFQNINEWGFTENTTGSVVIEKYNHSLWVGGQAPQGNGTTYTYTSEYITGSVVYDMVNKTLTLNNAHIGSEGVECLGITSYVPGLRIVLVGDNTIHGTGFANSINSKFADMIIEGSGTLDVSRDTWDCISMRRSNLTIRNGCSVIAKSYSSSSGYTGSGLQGDGGSTLYVDNASLVAEGHESRDYGSIGGFNNVVLSGGVSVTSPLNLSYSTSGQYNHYGTPDYPCCREITIERNNHSLWVAGHKLAGSGTHTFTGYGITGSVVYDFATNTLTLSDATIHASNDRSGIYNLIPNLKIQLIGGNVVSGCQIGPEAIYSGNGNLTITGTGTLEAAADFGSCIVVTSGNLSIQGGCTVSAKAPTEYFTGTGIVGEYTRTLYINNATVIAEGHDEHGAIGGFGNVSLTGVSVMNPVDATYNTTNYRYEKNGEAVTDELFISDNNRGLWVAGHKLQGNGNYNFTGSGITGSVVYDNQTNTLTLTNATIDATLDGIKNYIQNLKIKLVGTDTIKAGNYMSNGIYSGKGGLVIKGPGSLYVSSASASAIKVDAGNFYISDGCSVKAHAPESSSSYSGSAIEGGATSSSFYIADADLDAQGFDNTYGSIGGFHYVHIQGTTLTSPTGISYNSTTRRYENGSGEVTKGPIVIERTNHSLWVSGDKLKGSGSYTFSSSGITQGSAVYNFATNTLTLTNSIVIGGFDCEAIKNCIPDLKIELVGDNIVSPLMSYAPLYSYGNLTLQGTGALTASTYVGSAIVVEEGNLTIQGGCIVTASAKGTSNTSKGSGIRGASGRTLFVNGSAVKADGKDTDFGSIGGFGTVSLMNGVTLVSPANAIYSSAHRCFTTDGSTAVTEQIDIEAPDYDLWVSGTRVGCRNRNDVLGDGKVSYNPTTNTLTLTNVHLENNNVVGVRNKIDGLQLVLVGDNYISNSRGPAIQSDNVADLTIKGTGQLHASGSHGIYASGNLTIEDGLTIDVEAISSGGAAAIYGFSSSICTIGRSVINATAIHTTVGVIYGFGSLVFEDGEGIMSPSNAVWNASNHRIEQYGEYFKGPLLLDYQSFKVQVGGVWVNVGNMHDVLGNGQVSYDPESNVLTLNNASITNSASASDGIKAQIDGMRIFLIGNNTITSTDDGVEITNASITFLGHGTLTVNSYYGIYGSSVSSRTLSITDGCRVILNGASYGVSYAGPVHVSSAELHAKGNTKSVSCKTLTHYQTTILSPTGALLVPGEELNPTSQNGAICYSGTNNPVKGEYVIIAPQPYDLWVGGVQVNTANRDNVLGDGKVSYNPGEKRLTLNNATVNATGSSNYGIYSKIVGLTIEVIGTNTVTASAATGLYATQSNLTIEGTGVLNVTGTVNGIFIMNGDLTIQGGCEVNATATSSGQTPGIGGSVGRTFTVDKSTVNASTNSTWCCPIRDFSYLTLNGCSITTPAGAVWDYYDARVELNGNTVTSQVIIEPVYYYIKVAGIKVTSANCNDVLHDGYGGNPGSVHYDPATNELTLDNAYIDGESTNGIVSNKADLKINLVGVNRVYSTYTAGIRSTQNLIIQGLGTLYLEGDDGIWANGCDLTIRGGCTVSAYGFGTDDNSGIYGSNNCTLTIDRSRVEASSDYVGYSAIWGFTNLVFTDNKVQFIQPYGGTYSNRQVRKNDQIYSGDIEIDGEAYPVWVAGVQVTSANCDNIMSESLTQGTASYDAVNHILTLNDASIDRMGLGEYCITYENLSPFTIKLNGRNYLEGNEGDGVYGIVGYANPHHTELTIEGPGILECNGGPFEIFGFGNDNRYCDLSIVDGAEVYFDSYLNASGSGSYLNKINLTVEDAIFTASQITNLNSFRGVVVEPDGGRFNSTLNGGCIAVGNQLAENVVISDCYDLVVAGTQVTSYNAHNIPSEFITSGTASYDYETMTLTLDNVYANVDDDLEGIWWFFADDEDIPLYIELIGENTIIAPHSTGIFAEETGLVFKGSGSLMLQSVNGIWAGNGIKLQDACSLNVITSGDADCAAFTCNGFLQIDENCVLVAQNNPQSTMSTLTSISALQLNGVTILQPVGAYFSNESHGLEVDGNIYNGYVEIRSVEFDLWVKGTRVTSSNCSDVLGNGNVRYDYFTQTLTLNQVSITAQNTSGIYNQIEGLNIELIGTNVINSNQDGIVIDGKNTTIKGSGTLTINSTDNGIYASNMGDAVLSLEDGCKVTINENEEYGILAEGAIRVYYSTLDIRNANQPILADDLILEYSYFNTPRGAVFDADDQRVEDANGNKVTGRVVIKPLIYDIRVAGIQVTPFNAADILGDGTVSYDPSSEILTLNNAHINYSGSSSYAGIDISIYDLIIELIGDNTITSNSTGIYADAGALTIQGDGTLTITARYDGIGLRSSFLTIQGGCSVDVTTSGTSYYSGIDCDCYEDETLTIDHSYLKSKTSSTIYSAIYGFNDMSLDGVNFTLPNQGYYSNSDVRSSDGTIYRGQVVIEPTKYPLWIADKQVDIVNAYDVFGDGTVRYDDTQHKLLLSGADINGNFNGIVSKIEDLTIELVGYNVIAIDDDSDYSAIEMSYDATISGAGTLHITAPYGILGDRLMTDHYPNLTIEGGCYVSSTCYSEVVYLGYTNGGTLTVDHATLEGMNEVGDVYIQLGDLNMIGTEISIPAGGVYSNGKIKTSSGHNTDHFVISPIKYGLWIAGVQVDAMNASDVLGDGTVSFDAATSSLYLNNAHIEFLVDLSESDNPDGIYNEEIANLNIVLSGENTIIAGDDGINLNSTNAVISGDGTLTIDALYGIYGNNLSSELTIRDGCTAIVNADYYGVWVHGLTVDKSEFRVTGTMSYSVRVYDLELVGTQITTPENAVWNQNTGYITLNNQNVKTQVVFASVSYDLVVGGRVVTSVNASDVLGDGTVHYNPDTKTLTLNNAVFGYTIGMMSLVHDLTIVLEGQNCINGVIEGMEILDNTTISGTGTLTIFAGDGIVGYDDYGNYPSLTIEGGCVVMIESTEVPVFLGYGQEDGVLTVEDSKLVMISREGSSSVICGSLSLYQTLISIPDGGEFASHRIVDAAGNVVSQSTIEPYNVFVGTEDVYWSNANNWSMGVVPDADSKVLISSECVADEDAFAHLVILNRALTVSEGKVFTAQTIQNTNRDRLIIEDGAQLFHYNDGVGGTMEKEIEGYGANTTGGYYLISQPFYDGIDVEYEAQYGGTNLTVGDYDLYRYDEPTAYWINQKQDDELGNSQFDFIGLGMGCLYANRNDITIRMEENFAKGFSNADYIFAVRLSHLSTILSGFYLVGNPFPCNAHVYMYDGDEGYAMVDYYKMNASKTELELVSGEVGLAPMEGAFVQYLEGYPYAIFWADEVENARGKSYEEPVLNIGVSKGEEDTAALSNVLIHLDRCSNVGKFMLDEKNTHLSIVSDGKEYGSFALEGQDKLQLNFKALEEGVYTISLSGYNREVVLVDTLTGIETNLGKGAYTFHATPNDSVERFVLKF